MGKRMSRKKGLTQMEIIAVLILLAALALVVVPRCIGSDKKTHQKAALQTVTEGGVQVNAAAARYILEFDRVPTSVEDLKSLSEKPLRNISGEGDWNITFTDGRENAPSVRVTATGREGGPSNIPSTVSRFRDFPLPRDTV